MHRIDGPGATVDNKFTEGNPATAVPATEVTDDWLNDVQEELISILTAAGITPVKGTQNQILLALRAAGVHATPPQFDSTTKAATTAFVQRALGNFGAWTSIVASGSTIPAASVGNAVQVQLPSDGFIYLPLTSQCVSGACLHILNTSVSAKVTLTAQAPDVLTLSSITLHPGESVTVIASPSVNSWFVMAGGGALDKTARFGASLAENFGWQRLPSGLLMQWGGFLISSGGTITANFPIAFPVACDSFVCSPTETAATPYFLNGNNISTSQYTVRGYTQAGAAANIGYRWVAFGR